MFSITDWRYGIWVRGERRLSSPFPRQPSYLLSAQSGDLEHPACQTAAALQVLSNPSVLWHRHQLYKMKAFSEVTN